VTSAAATRCRCSISSKNSRCNARWKSSGWKRHFENREAIFQAEHNFKPQLEFVGWREAALLAAELDQGIRSGWAIEELACRFQQLKGLL